MKIYISQPCIGGQVHIKCLQTMQYMTQYHETEMHWIENCSLITKARNEHFSMFLASDCDYLLSIDSDLVITPPGCLDNMIQNYPKDGILGGLYAMKAIDTVTKNPPLNGVPLPNQTIQLNTGIKEMKYIPTGFMLISKSVAKKLAEHYKPLQYSNPQFPIPFYAVYNTMIHENNFLPEDFSFCQRCKDIGIKIYADTNIILGHIGQYLYSLEHLIKKD